MRRHAPAPISDCSFCCGATALCATALYCLVPVMSFEGVKFTDVPSSNGKTVSRALNSEKTCSFDRWETVKDQIGPHNKIIRAKPGNPMRSIETGRVKYCCSRYPLLHKVTCCYAEDNRKLHLKDWKVPQHDQPGYLTSFLRHIRTSQCTVCRYPGCFAPEGLPPGCRSARTVLSPKWSW